MATTNKKNKLVNADFQANGIGKNKNLSCSLYQGDCLEKLKHIPDKSVDLVVMDPPYLFDKGGGGGCFGSKNRKYLNEIEPLGDGFDFQVLNELERVLKKINLYIFCNKNLFTKLVAHYAAKDVVLDYLFWHKTNPTPACNNRYLSDVEYVLFVREKSVKVFGDYHSKSKVYTSTTNKKDKKLYGNHPTIKPIPLLEKYIKNSTEEGATVLDCFSGTSSTGVAALNTGRSFIGIELAPEYFQVGQKRIEETVSLLTPSTEKTKNLNKANKKTAPKKQQKSDRKKAQRKPQKTKTPPQVIDAKLMGVLLNTGFT